MSKKKVAPIEKVRKREPRPGEGRPSKYDPAFCGKLEKHMAEGFSFKSFAGIIGVTYETLYQWEKTYGEFSESKSRGLAKNLVYWETQGNRGIWNDKEGPTLNTTAWIFMMKNRHGWSNNEISLIASPPSESTAPKVIISLPDNGRSAPTESKEE